MERILLIILLTLASVLGSTSVSAAQQTIDPEIVEYAEAFDRDFGTDHTKIRDGIYFNTESGKRYTISESTPAVGICYQTIHYQNPHKPGQPLAVILDKKVWDRLPYIGRSMLVYHELAHCLMGAVHEDGRLKSLDLLYWQSGYPDREFSDVFFLLNINEKCPSSIMKSRFINSYEMTCFGAYWQYYKDKLYRDRFYLIR